MKPKVKLFLDHALSFAANERRTVQLAAGILSIFSPKTMVKPREVPYHSKKRWGD